MRRRHRLLLALGLCALTSAAQAERKYEEGAHETLSQRVFHAQNLEYARILAEFDDQLRHYPDDSLAAVERCRFIDVFAYAEDTQNDQAIADSEACHRDLASDAFANSSDAQLFLLDNQWGEEGIKKGEALLTRPGRWTRGQLAKLHGSMADRYRNVDPMKAGDHALTAVNLDPDSSHRLFAAQHLLRIGARARAIEMIRASPTEQWNTWTLRSALSLLLDMGETAIALDILRAHPEVNVDAAIRTRLATALQTGGRVDDAQALMPALSQDIPQGTAGQVLRQELFEFQLANGTQDEAVRAYRALRDAGMSGDPYGRERLRLFLRHPAAPWQADELLGFGALILVLAALALVPLILIVPLHYWSLVRRVRGGTTPPADSPWGLGHLWYALAVVSVAGGVATYVFTYHQFHDWFGIEGVGSAKITDDRDLGRTFVWMQMLTLIGLLPLVLRRGMKSRLLGTWTFGHAACAGIGSAFLLLMANSLVGLANKPAIALGGDTIRAMQGVYGMYGTVGLLLMSALAAPILEEFVFRGVFLRAAARHIRLWIAVLLQGVVFMALHDQAGASVFLFALALVAATLAWKSNGLVAPIALHVTNNVMASLAIMGVTRSVSVLSG